jgi:hypothetical protein
MRRGHAPAREVVRRTGTTEALQFSYDCLGVMGSLTTLDIHVQRRIGHSDSHILAPPLQFPHDCLGVIGLLTTLDTLVRRRILTPMSFLPHLGEQVALRQSADLAGCGCL